MARTLIKLIIEACENFVRHQPLQAAAALSFYAVFSLAPLILVVIAIAGLFFSDVEVQNALLARISELISNDAAQLVGVIIENATNEERNVFSLIVGGTVMLIGATTAFAQLHSAINQIWGMRPPGSSLVLAFLKGRLWSFAFLLLIGMLLVASLFLGAMLDTFNEFLSTRIVVDDAFWYRLDLALSYGVTTLLIATIYKFLPDTQVAWRHTALAAVVATLLFEGSKFLIEYYVSRMSPESSFGAAGSVIVFLLWIYCAALIILIGAEISRASAVHAGRRRGPPSNTGPSSSDGSAARVVRSDQEPNDETNDRQDQHEY